MKALTPLKKHRFAVFFAPALKAIECVCELLIPFIVRAIIDDGLSVNGSHYGDQGFSLGLCASVFGLSLLGFFCTMVAQYVSSRVTTLFSYELKKNIYHHIIELSPLQLERYGNDKALNLLNSASVALQGGVQMFMRLLVRAPFLVIGSVIAAFLVNVYAGIVVVSSLALCAAFIGFIMAVTPKDYDKLNAELDLITREGEDLVSGARVIRAFRKEEDYSHRFKRRSESYRKQALKLSRINAFINPLTFGLVNLAVVLVLYLGSYALPTTGISVGSIVALISFLTQSLNALIQFTRLVTSVSKAYAGKTRIDGFLAIEPDIVDGPLERETPLLPGETIYDLRGVSVSFGGEVPALDHVDFHVDKGEHIGIIGGTGSGKSTLLSLLLRYIDPSEGVVSFHGHDIKESKLSSVRSIASTVRQKPQLLEGTIRQNLTLGKECAEEDLIQASQAALAYEFIMGKEKGFDALVEEGGANFSGGQRQRLLIARAILSGREVMMLDDATSALDYKSDRTVRQNLSRLEGLTLIMVSQRATSVKECDRIYVLDKGRVVGVGTHEELLSSCPIYRDIHEAQVSQR